MKKPKLLPYTSYLEEIAHTHGIARVFDDFLQIVVCCLSMGRAEELYYKTIAPYSKEDLALFSGAFASLVMQMEANPLSDPFGDWFQENVSRGHNGQYFTPEPVCDLMASLCNRGKAQSTCNDPACGSGRLILASAKINRNRYFVASDISYTCCLMTLINMCLFSIRGEVLHQNTITLECWRRWFVIVDSATKIPAICEVTDEDLNHSPTSIEDVTPEPITELIQPVKKSPSIQYVSYPV